MPFRSFLVVYVEPASLLWTDCPGPAFANGPNLRKEDYDITFELVRLWDVKGLAFLLPMQKDGSWRWYGDILFLNCFKNSNADRMVGDCRLRNSKEGRLPGPFRSLPTAYSLGNLKVNPLSQRLSVCISDRRDFYHQFAVSPERACTNALWPPLRRTDIAGLQAFERHLSSRPGAYDRRVHVDHFGPGFSSEGPLDDELFQQHP